MFLLFGSPVSALGIQLNSAACRLPPTFMPSHGYVQQKAASRALKIEQWD